MKDYPLVILDWDYHTFDVVDEVGDVLAIYDEQAQNSEFIYVEGCCGAAVVIVKKRYTAKLKTLANINAT